MAILILKIQLILASGDSSWNLSSCLRNSHTLFLPLSSKLMVKGEVQPPVHVPVPIKLSVHKVLDGTVIVYECYNYL